MKMSKLLLGRVTLPLIATGGYVLFNDARRSPKMERQFSRGALLGPVKENVYEITYHPRPQLEERILHVLNPTFTNQYYLVRGEIGAGKSRLVVEAVRKMMNERGRKGEGAPIYVLASQGKSFADTLSKAVKFNYDEHISFKFALNLLLKMNSLPSKKEHEKLKRVLESIEESAYRYMSRTGRPAVIIIDDVGWVGRHMKSALHLLQIKAKLWADTNIAKVVFITNDEEVEVFFQKNQSCWSRCDVPIYIGDLCDEEAEVYFGRDNFYEEGIQQHGVKGNMDWLYCKKVVSAAGGRIHHLNQCRRDWEEGFTAEEAIDRLRCKGREKMLEIKWSKNLVKALSHLNKTNEFSLPLRQIVELTDFKTVVDLVRADIITFKRDGDKILVKMESRTMEFLLDEIQHSMSG